MDIQAYISSGIIENYVLGATTAEESAEVEQLAAQYPEVQQEIEANKHALLAYVLEFEQEPPAHIRDKVLDKLDQLSQEDDAFLLADTDTENIEREIAEIQQNPVRKLFPFKTYLIAASFVLLVASISANVYFYSEWNKTKDDLRSALLDKQVMANTLKANQNKEAEMEQELALMKSPKMASVKLTAVKGKPDCSAKIYWDTNSKFVYIDASDLPEPPKNKQYQLWYIDGKNVVDAGVFDMGNKANKLQKLKLVPNAQAFAVTLEKYGGVPKSEGDMYALGKMADKVENQN